jgi:hypothetical protein
MLVDIFTWKRVALAIKFYPFAARTPEALPWLNFMRWLSFQEVMTLIREPKTCPCHYL